MLVSPAINLLVALAGSVAATDRGVPATSPGPDSPITAIQSLARAYSDRSMEDYAALLTADYRFHFSSKREIDVGVFVDGFTREHELKSASGPALHVFHLVRGDAAVRAEGQPTDHGRWYVRRWLEDVEGLTLALAENRGRCGEPAPRPRAPARSEGSTRPAGTPVDLAIHPLGNPACPTVDLTCDLPGSEPALLDLPNPPPGTVRVEAGAGARIVPGVYWVRLSQGARRPTTKMIVVARSGTRWQCRT